MYISRYLAKRKNPKQTETILARTTFPERWYLTVILKKCITANLELTCDTFISGVLQSKNLASSRWKRLICWRHMVVYNMIYYSLNKYWLLFPFWYFFIPYELLMIYYFQIHAMVVVKGSHCIDRSCNSPVCLTCTKGGYSHRNNLCDLMRFLPVFQCRC